MNNIDKSIKELFIYPVIPPNIGISTHYTIKEANLLSSSNITLIYLNLGNDGIGYISLTVATNAYTTLVSVAFLVSRNQGTYVVVFPNSIRPQIATLECRYTVHMPYN